MGRTLILTSPHAKGNDVAAFQRALTNKGYYHGPINEEYDPLTAQAAWRAKYWLGYLHPDHVAGDRLYGYLMGARRTPAMLLIAKRRKAAVPKQTHGQKVLEVAKRYIGTIEVPVNHTQFGRWYGADGVPWCDIFVSFCQVTAGSKAFIRGHNYSYVPNMAYDAKMGRNHLSISHPVVEGDVITFDWDKDGVPDHTGLFVKWIDKAAGTFESIEGNTSPANNSNGGQVMHRSDRVISEVHSFIYVGA